MRTDEAGVWPFLLLGGYFSQLLFLCTIVFDQVCIHK